MQTVISVFDDSETAKCAVQRLVELGVKKDDLHLQQRDTAGASRADAGATTDTTYTSDQEQRGILSSIGYFFASLFGQDNPSSHAGTYAEAVRRGGSVLIVDTQDDQQAEGVVSLLHEMGAVDVDARVDEWRAGGWTSDEPNQNTDTRQKPQKPQMQQAEQEQPQSAANGGVRIIKRASQEPLRELVRRRDNRTMAHRGQRRT